MSEKAGSHKEESDAPPRRSKKSIAAMGRKSTSPGRASRAFSTTSKKSRAASTVSHSTGLSISDADDLDEEEEGGDDFGQNEIKEKKQAEDEIRKRAGSWAEDADADDAGDDDGDAESAGGGGGGGGGMMDLLGRSKAAKEELAAKEAKESEMKKKKRKRVQAKTKGKKDQKKEEDEKKKSILSQEEEWVEPTYDSEAMISKPVKNTDLVPDNILKFYESYGYDSGRRDNLNMIDSNTLVYISGNYLHFYNIQDKEVFLCRRAAQGYGLGHIALHPSKKFFAVGEKGYNPVIVVYTWPSVSVYRILRRGTLRGYSFLNFNPAGDILCSQGMDPDYMLTIWDWGKEKVLLRCKAFANDIYRVTFSPTLAGDLTTCGVGHIRFWKMASTFTGLKLQGAIGRFGKTEISDIQDYVELPNGKVLSGCEWGNILVWDGGLIVCEICGMEDSTLHRGELTNLIMMSETNEVLTVGKDGYLRIWDVDAIDIADTLVDDTGKYAIEPAFELRLSGDARPQCCVKNIAAEEGQNNWYCQDGWGRVWDVSISTAVQNNEYSPQPIFFTPGGGPINCVVCSVEHTIMALGTEGGHLWLIDYITKKCLVRRHYNNSVTKLFWLPLKFDPRGVTFLAAFGDGCVRSYSIQAITPETQMEDDDTDDHGFRRGQPYEIGLNQVLRFCKGAVNVMKYDDENEILYLCGDDRSLWGVYLFYDEDEDCAVLEPLAYFTTPFSVYNLDLHPTKHHRMILAGRSSRVAECRRPDWTECITDKSFYQGKLRGRRWWFNSGKSERRKMERKEWRKVERERRIKELKEDFKRREQLGLPVEHDIELARLNEEFRKAQMADDEEPIYKPEKASEFLGIYYYVNPNVGDANIGKTFFVHMGDYDAGYIYECKCTRPEIGGFHPVPPTPPFKTDENDVAVRCYLLSDDDEYLLFGMADGSIRVMPRVDIKKKLAEMIRLEREEEERQRKANKEQAEESGAEEEQETEATTAPQIPDDQQKEKKGKKKKMSGGKVQLPPFQPSIYPYDLENFFALPMHDPNRGAIREMAWSGDNHFLVSVGEDGSIFSYRWDPDGTLEFPTDNLPPSNLPTESLEYEFLPDEESAYMLTVEETKQQEEKEKVRGLQEEFKEDVRSELRDLREVFKSIKQRNKEIPEQYRLTEEELKLPDEIYAELQQKFDEEVEEVFKIHEYESAQTIVQLEKIERNFFKPLLYHHIVVKDVCHETQTHTLRQKKLSEEFLELKSKNDEIMTQEQVRSNISLNVAMSEVDEEVQPIVRVFAKDIIGEYEHKLPTYNIETIHNIRHLERRLEERYFRELAWAELLKRKVSKDFIDPEDKERLDYARKNRGDFKLQASETYLGDHATIAERRQKIINMKMWIHDTKEEYNRKVLEARDEKVMILKECKKLEEKIKLIQPYIPPELRRRIPPIYDMEQCEMPENVFEITQQDIEFEENTEIQAAGLSEFRDQMKEELYGIMRPEKALVVDEEIKDFMAPSVRHTKSVDLEFENMTVHKYRKYLFTPKTDKEHTRFEARMWPKLIEQEVMFKQLSEIIDYFHKRIKHLHDTKVKMDIDLHIKTVGLMTLIRELDIAKEFEAQERGILERLRVQKQEFHDTHHKLDKIKKRMTKMNADIKKLEGEVAVIQKEVSNVIGEKGRWTEYLWKVYKKKVKMEVIMEGGESEAPLKRRSSSSDSSDASESTSQDTGSDLYKLPKLKLDVNVCPEHLDKAIFNKICELRQRKALTEMEIENEKREVEKVAEDYLEVERVYKKLENRLTDTGQDIRILQRRRQKRMNELKCMLVMRLDQINCVDMEEVGDIKGGVFEKLVKTFPSENKILVFPKGMTDSLESRSAELNIFTEQEKQRMKNGRQMHFRLIEELKKAEKRVEELKGKVKKDMVFKFGREVDLDKVCAALINLELLDKEIQLDKLRKVHYFERQRAIDVILDAKEELTGEIRENSNLKILEAMVLERRRDLDYFIRRVEKEKSRREERNESRKQLLDPGRFNSSASGAAVMKGASSLMDDEGLQSQHPLFFEDINEEIANMKKILREYESRAKDLRKALKICKRKSGLPPILPLARTAGPCDIPPGPPGRMKLPPIREGADKKVSCSDMDRRYRVQAKELPEMNQYCGDLVDPKFVTCGVRTLFEKKLASFETEITFPPTVIPSKEQGTDGTKGPPVTPKGEDDEPSSEYKEYAGEGDETIAIFEKQFDEFLKHEREEVMEYLGEVDEEMLGMVRASAYDEADTEEESDGEGLETDNEMDVSEAPPPTQPETESEGEQETKPQVRESVEVLEQLKKYSETGNEAGAGWEADLAEVEEDVELGEDSEEET